VLVHHQTDGDFGSPNFFADDIGWRRARQSENGWGSVSGSCSVPGTSSGPDHWMTSKDDTACQSKSAIATLYGEEIDFQAKQLPAHAKEAVAAPLCGEPLPPQPSSEAQTPMSGNQMT